MAQALELYVATLADILNRHFNAQIDADEIILRESKKTLGQLIIELKKRASLSAEAASALAEALEARNYIAHECFIRINGAFSNEEAFAAALGLLKERGKRVAVGTAIAQGFVCGFCEALGIELSNVLIRQDI